MNAIENEEARRAGDGLDDRLRTHYAGAALDRRTRSTLLAATRAAARSRRPVLRLAFGTALVASLALASVVLHLAGSVGERTERTVREAAMNHNARLTLEFAAADLDALSDTMARLPFELRRPERLGGEWTTVGGRYCSIAGHLAAHVRLVAADGSETLSLFVTRGADDLEALEGRHRGIDGVDVELFEERGLFYALARSAS